MGNLEPSLQHLVISTRTRGEQYDDQLLTVINCINDKYLSNNKDSFKLLNIIQIEANLKQLTIVNDVY